MTNMNINAHEYLEYDLENDRENDLELPIPFQANLYDANFIYNRNKPAILPEKKLYDANFIYNLNKPTH